MNPHVNLPITTLFLSTISTQWPIALAVIDGSETSGPSSDANKTPASTGSATTAASTFQPSQG